MKDLKQTQQELLKILKPKTGTDRALYKTIITYAWTNGFECSSNIVKTVMTKYEKKQ